MDGHGDLHLQHVWFETDASEPLVIDCLEFDAGLRRIDAAADIAFAAMDLAYRGRDDLAERFLRVYASERDDFDLYGVVDYFIGYRAAVLLDRLMDGEPPPVEPEVLPRLFTLNTATAVSLVPAASHTSRVTPKLPFAG